MSETQKSAIYQPPILIGKNPYSHKNTYTKESLDQQVVKQDFVSESALQAVREAQMRQVPEPVRPEVAPSMNPQLRAVRDMGAVLDWRRSNQDVREAA